jgi:hypothetical protein
MRWRTRTTQASSPHASSTPTGTRPLPRRHHNIPTLVKRGWLSGCGVQLLLPSWSPSLDGSTLWPVGASPSKWATIKDTESATFLGETYCLCPTLDLQYERMPKALMLNQCHETDSLTASSVYFHLRMWYTAAKISYAAPKHARDWDFCLLMSAKTVVFFIC